MSNAQTTDRFAALHFGFADRLEKSLKFAGITSQEMADYLDVARTTVSNYINGHTRPSKLAVKEWALRTGVPVVWLNTGEFPPVTESERPVTSPKHDSFEIVDLAAIRAAKAVNS